MSRRRSLTAEGVAALRARARYEPEPLRGPDTLASRLVGWKLRMLSTTPVLRDVMLSVYERVLPGAYFYMLARTKCLDAFLAREIASGAQQFLLLGAGLDSRAYRFAELRRRLVFEVDQPATQAWKRQRVARALGALPRHVQYVPVDFDRDRLADRLAAHGYSPGRRTCVIWEGVTMYLDRSAVDAVFTFVAGTSGSAIGFDYIVMEAFEDPRRFHGAAQGMAYVERRGEPYRSGLDARALGPYLRGHGFTLESHLDAAALEREYLTLPGGGRRGRVCAHFAVATARHLGD